MTNYEKMTLESFLKNLRAKKYENATGARRAVGKSQDLSNKDKDKARAEIDKFFGVAAGPKKAAKKIPPKAKAAPKKAAKKIAAKSKVTHAKKAPAVKRQPVTSNGQADSASPSTDARVMRQHAAAQVIATLHGKHPLDAELEAKLLRTSALEYIANSSVLDKSENPADATPAITKKERVARPRVNVQAAPPVAEEAPPESGPEQTNGASSNPAEWTQEQIEQDKKLGELKAQAESSG